MGPGVMGKRELRSTQAQAKRPAPDQNEREHIHVRGSKRADVLLQNVSLRYAIVKDKPVSVKKETRADLPEEGSQGLYRESHDKSTEGR